MKKVILSLIALSTISTLALPAQAKNIDITKNAAETESVDQLKGHKKRRHGHGHGHYHCHYRHHHKHCHHHRSHGRHHH